MPEIYYGGELALFWFLYSERGTAEDIIYLGNTVSVDKKQCRQASVSLDL